MRETYQIANRMKHITSLYEAVHAYCAAYRSEGAPEFSIRTSQADIDFEREKSARKDATEGCPVRHFPDWYLEELAVYRKIAEKMPE